MIIVVKVVQLVKNHLEIHALYISTQKFGEPTSLKQVERQFMLASSVINDTRNGSTLRK